MNVVLTSELLFADKTSWENSEKYRDDFTKNLLEILEFVNLSDDCHILWNDVCENILWNSSDKIPWRVDKDFKNKSIVAINNLLHNSQLLVRNNLGRCIIEPYTFLQLHREFDSEILAIIHPYLHANIAFYLGACKKMDYKISCACSNVTYNPKIITCKDDFYTYDEILQYFWTKEQIENCLKTLISLYCKNNLQRNILYNYTFTKSFLKDVINSDNIRRNTIIKQMSLKLTLSLSEARNNGSLQEEFVNSQNRIRVTEASRISYVYDNHNIIFTRYYSESEHNVGISNTRR